jgi:hypothetical protein
MLTNEFCVRGKFWEKDPHTHSPPPPPPSKCGRCVQQLVSEQAFTTSLNKLEGDEENVGMFYRQRMLVIDGKYNNDDGLSTGRMCQAGTKSILGRCCRASSIRSEEIVQRIVGMFNRQSVLVIDDKIRVCIDGKTGTKSAQEESMQSQMQCIGVH